MIWSVYNDNNGVFPNLNSDFPNYYNFDDSIKL